MLKYLKNGGKIKKKTKNTASGTEKFKANSGNS